MSDTRPTMESVRKYLLEALDWYEQSGDDERRIMKAIEAIDAPDTPPTPELVEGTPEWDKQDTLDRLEMMRRSLAEQSQLLWATVRVIGSVKLPVDALTSLDSRDVIDRQDDVDGIVLTYVRRTDEYAGADERLGGVMSIDDPEKLAVFEASET